VGLVRWPGGPVWSDARQITGDKVVRAYRLYLAGSAMSFERGWLSLHQTLAARPTGQVEDGSLRGAQSVYPFNREYIYR
jgi:cyclopropane-fatty-acyl-phospholipid synthase